MVHYVVRTVIQVHLLHVKRPGTGDTQMNIEKKKRFRLETSFGGNQTTH